jgi:hypothetical protein
MDKAKFNPEEFGFDNTSSKGDHWFIDTTKGHWVLEKIFNTDNWKCTYYSYVYNSRYAPPGGATNMYEGPIDTYVDAMELFEKLGVY